ncbi:MAG: PmoA family protein [Pirellulales bacterium]
MRRRLFLIVAGWWAFAPHVPAAEITAEKNDHGVTVKIDGKLFCEYLVRSGNKPVIWPIIGPTGKAMTRSFPLDPKAPDSESRDHPMHRSLWFAHGDVNGVDFWFEKSTSGSIVHRSFERIEGGREAIVVARADWLKPDGKRICQDERTLRFGADERVRWIDFQIVLRATDGPLTFGDTEEAGLAMRVADTMTVDAQRGGKIINREGKTDGAAWGQPAAWVDYHGPVQGEQLGVAILNHPSSFRHPTTWHVRPYGLFAANPFGLHHFSGGRSPSGAHKVAAGETLSLRHRVLLHQGDEKAGHVAEAFAAYARTKD